MPTIEHEAPLVLLREEPSLVATLLREALGVTLPAFATAEVSDAEFTQALPVERRADLVVCLRDGSRQRRTVAGVVVEVQRGRDGRKRWSWPLYLASLHARLRCPTVLPVLATTDRVARWAAAPIATFQPNSPFVPLVLGPAQVPRLAPERAVREPWLALLAGIVHGNGPDGVEAVRAAVAALRMIPRTSREPCYDALDRTLNEVMRLVLESQMHFENYEFKGPKAMRQMAAARLSAVREVVLKVAERHGPVPDELRALIEACADEDRLCALAVELASAADAEAVGARLARLARPRRSAPTRMSKSAPKQPAKRAPRGRSAR